MLQTCWKLVLNINKHTYINKEMIDDLLHSRKQTWNPKMEGWKLEDDVPFQRGDFQVPAVRFRGSRKYLQGNKWVFVYIDQPGFSYAKSSQSLQHTNSGGCVNIWVPLLLLVYGGNVSLLNIGNQNNSTVWLHFFLKRPTHICNNTYTW